ncbi:putative 3-hydroxyisobutyryl-CoA hydrolase 3 [Sesamum angolense]|uniref:3-hydroxyisobutyryl-CoA hydrolase n=1 Tax=Sesamum angolense TaxID=2727404 RepID=A0AAE2C2B2_9LAMI|nr:putative 3-hydroxyisobutyryl-CoA hydrolase 3 [Sesamum angolense]
MASLLSFDRDLNQVSEMKRVLEDYEVDDTVKIIMLTGQGKAFCAGGDVVRSIQLVSIGHWSLTAMFYRKQLLLDYLIATYKKPLVRDTSTSFLVSRISIIALSTEEQYVAVEAVQFYLKGHVIVEIKF